MFPHLYSSLTDCVRLSILSWSAPTEENTEDLTDLPPMERRRRARGFTERTESRSERRAKERRMEKLKYFGMLYAVYLGI